MVGRYALALALPLIPQLTVAAPTSRDRVGVLLIASRTASDEPTSDQSNAGRMLFAGEEGTMYLLTDRSLCLRQIGTTPPGPEHLVPGSQLWTAKARIVAVDMPAIVVDIDWSRERFEADGHRSRAAGDRRTVTFKEGERQTLDFLASDDPSGPCGISLRVDLEASIEEDPRLAGAPLHYEAWLIDTPPRGEPITRRLDLSAKQGELVSLPFDPLRWEVPGVRFKDGRGAQAAVTVTGQVRGRLRDDGTIDVWLNAGRFIGLVESGDDNAGGNGDGGQKTFTVRAGETVALVLPPIAGGGHTLWLNEAKGASGSASPVEQAPVTITSSSVTLNNGAFFAGHTMSLRLTATRMSDEKTR